MNHMTLILGLIVAFFLISTVLTVAVCMRSSQMGQLEGWEESLAYEEPIRATGKFKRDAATTG